MRQLLPKTMYLAITFLIVNLFFTGTAFGQTTYYYKGTGNLNSTANWGLNTDGSGSTPSNFSTANRIFNIRNAATVSNAGTWTVSGTGSKIVVGDGTNACNLTIPTGTNTIVGTIDVSAAATLTLTNTTLPTLGTLNAASTVVYNASAAQNITAVTYGNLIYSGSSTGTFAGSCTIAGNFSCTSGNVTFNTSNATRTFTITGDFSMSSTGNLEFGSGNGTSVINLSGDFSKTNGYMVTTTATVNADFNMVGTTQTMRSTGGTIMKWVDFNINSGSTCSLAGDFNMNGSAGTSMIFTVNSGGTLNTNGFNVIGSAIGNTFVLNSGATLGITSTAGITTAGTASGNIQSLVRTFNAGANYTYNGSANQSTGTGFPTNLTGTLTIDNAGNTVTLSAARTIASGGTVDIINGVFAAGTNLTMASTSSIVRSEGSLTGTLQGTGVYNVTYTGNSKTTGPELTNSGLNNVTVSLTSGQTVTLSAATTLDGTLTIGSGSTLDVSVSNYAVSLAGNWTNNGGTFTAGTGTVTFNGTGAQSINGTATSQSFNNVIVNKTAGQLLNTGGSIATVSTKDLTLTQGNFTAPATLTISGNFLHTAGTFTAGTNTGISGNWTRNGGTFTPGTNTVTFTGSSAQLINGSAATGFYDLTINETAASTTVTSQTTAFSVARNLAVTTGNLILQATNTDYTVTGNVSTSAGGTLTHSVGWDLSGKLLSIGGSLTIDGAFVYTVRSHIQMTGAGAKTIKSGTSSFSILTLLLGTYTASGTVTVDDNFYPMYNSTGSFSTNGQAVTASSSCLNYGGTLNINGGSLTVISGLLIGSNSSAGTVNLSSGTLTTDGITLGDAAGTLANTLTQTGGSLQVNGAVTINQPAANIITNAWNINAGTVTVTGLLSFAGTNATTSRIGKIVITTGTLNVNGGISFAGTTPATKLIDMSTGGGTGTINMKGALTGAAGATLTAGTSGSIFNYADNTTAQTVNYFGAGAYHNLYINTTGGTGATLSAAITATNVTGNLRVLSGTLNNGGFAIAGNATRTIEVANAAFLKLGGTTSAFPTVFGTVTLGATSTVDYNGSGAQTVVAQNYGNLTTSLNGTRTVTFANAGTIGIAGVFSPAAGTTSYTVTNSTVSFKGTTGSQNIPAFTFNNLSINNTSGVALTGNVNTGAVLTLAGGNIDCSSYTLAVTNNAAAAIVRTSGHIIGNLQRAIATGANTYAFPVGTVSGYTPASLAFTAVGVAGTITIASADAVGTNYPSSLNTTKRLARNWPASSSAVAGITGSATFTYLPADLVGGAVSGNLKAYVYTGTHAYPTSNTNTSSSFTFNGLTAIGEFGAGECKGTIAPTFTKTMASSCGSGADGTITVTPAGGTAPYTYNWTSTPAGFSATTAAVTGLSSRDYTVVVSDVTTCSSTIPDITIWKALPINVTNNGGGSSSCGNTGYIILYGTSGVQPYTYSVDGSTYQASNTFNNLAAGTYTGYVKDLSGCIGTKTNIVVTGAAPIVVTANTRAASSCGNNGSIELYRTGGVGPYTYSLNDVTYQGSNVFAGLAGGTYTGWVKDSKGCKSSLANIVVAKAATLTVTAIKTNATACGNDGTIQLTGAGGVPGYTYSKTGAAGPYQSGNLFTGVAAGSYTCWIQDSKGCKNLVSVTIGSTAAMVVTATTSGAGGCNNAGKIQLFRTGGVAPFTFSIDNITYQSSNTFTGLAAGTYTGWVKDSKGCKASLANISLTAVSAVSATASFTNSSVCTNDGSIQLRPAGGVGPFTYSLDDISYQSGGHFPGLAPGSYTGWVKDVNGCKASVSVTISSNPVIATAHITAASSCVASNGSIQLFRTGGTAPYTYSLDGINFQSSNIFTGLVPGDYDGYVKDSKGCLGIVLNLSVGPNNCSLPFAGANKSAVITAKETSVSKVNFNSGLKVNAYPNPTATEFTLLLEGFSNDKVNIIVTDIMGKRVYQAEGNGKQEYRFGNKFVAGIYIVQVVQGNNKQSIKLVKE